MYIADLHIHSKYSRATSRDCDTVHLDLWARRKGIALIGTGDFTHPAWRQELRENLEEAGEGLYALRGGLRAPDATCSAAEPRFVLSAEISSIYKKNGRTRKVHNVILMPSLDAAETLSQKLEAIGNVHSDGRPILGLDCKDLLELTLESCSEAIFIPAHIWTPHFALFGAFSGFDTMEECFEDLTPYIHAVETGLSSDPPMNWRVSALDRMTLVSNSDAHSPAKLGRESNLLDTPLSYPALKRAIETGEGFAGTLEFFPEEGKYHLDGHRNCGVCLTPSETNRLDGKCPVCGKKLTIGVEHRVEALADRPVGFLPEGRKPFEQLVPLLEVIAASTGASAASKQTAALYARLLETVGPEFYVLRKAPPAEIEAQAGLCVAEGIRRLRAGKVERKPGFDGEYGVIRLFDPDELTQMKGQMALFGLPAVAKKPAKPKEVLDFGVPSRAAFAQRSAPAAESLNAQQMQAVEAEDMAVAVIAGPGTGKTKTLVAKIAHLVENCGASPREITAVTFTNQAAAEMRSRLEARLGGRRKVQGMTIGTFHAICLAQLKDASDPRRLLGAQDALDLAAAFLSERRDPQSPRAFLQALSAWKNGVAGAESDGRFEAFQRVLDQKGVYDFDDLLRHALRLPLPKRGFQYLLVDEFQDINPVQFELIAHWGAGAKQLFVIGDPDQSIYGFRGASSDCFGRLRADRPGIRVITLTENYRSTPQVLSAALPVLIRGDGAERHLNANRPAGAPVRLVSAASEFSEAVFIAKEISRMAGGLDMLEAQNRPAEPAASRSFSEIAVLCRTHKEARTVEACLRHDSIPCIISGREGYLSDETVRGALAFFRTLLDPRDVQSLRTALAWCWHCPGDLADAVCRSVEASELDVASLQAEFAHCDALLPWFEAQTLCAPKIAREKPRRLIDALRPLLPEGEKDAMEKLASAAVFHNRMEDFLQTVLLGEEADISRAAGKPYASGAVRILTLHAAKGLEFPVVFLYGASAGSIPLERAGVACDLAEERRLFYVGMTRAKEELILLTAGDASVFLEALPADVRRESASNRETPRAVQLSLF